METRSGEPARGGKQSPDKDSEETRPGGPTRGGKPSADKDSTETQKLLSEDNQLQRALEILKSYKIISQMRF
ncbi:MAG TPA: hypothetical protein DEO88_12935 [Syntrophobacteraceae bacterium]|nr:hypothetical protein [Syntrophobacteraceae bacterium]